ncbi:hypothetical protein ACWYXO_16020 [Janthinobacterium aestuarii]|uniref:hypothetical protein n=1 Tax=Janthinobacterium lividum TaxID=29581 RepID=UPI0012695CC5|nr:hypothetical protein [Janthinobacterium lividum]
MHTASPDGDLSWLAFCLAAALIGSWLVLFTVFYWHCFLSNGGRRGACPERREDGVSSWLFFHLINGDEI